MSRTKGMTNEEIRRAGLEALCRELGPVGMAHFLQQFEGGTGDFVEERQAWADRYTVAELAARIRERRRQREAAGTERSLDGSITLPEAKAEKLATAEG